MKLLKDIKRHRLTCLIVGLWALLSAAGLAGKDTLYRDYRITTYDTPYFVLVAYGIADGIYPWEPVQKTVEAKAEEFKKKVTEKEEAVTMPVGTNRMGEKQHGFETGDEHLVMREKLKRRPQNRVSSLGSVDVWHAEQNTAVPEEKHTAEVAVVEPEEVSLEFSEVDEEYFSDAVFIGDSRTVGLSSYGNLKNADYFATVGMNIYKLWSEEFCETEYGKVTLEAALTQKRYGKIYFQIGINEMGTGTVDTFMEAYRETVEKIRSLQPEAVLFVQGIMKVAEGKSAGVFENSRIEERNGRIMELADQKKIFYLDVNEVVCDAKGDLDSSLTFDNVHLYAAKYQIWVEYLLKHGICV